MEYPRPNGKREKSDLLSQWILAMMFLKSSRLLKWHGGEAWPGMMKHAGRKGWFCALREISWNGHPLVRQGKICIWDLCPREASWQRPQIPLICRPGLPWPPFSWPLLKPSFLRKLPHHTLPTYGSVHGSGARKTGPQTSSFPHTPPWASQVAHHASVARRSTPACPPPPLASPQAVSTWPHTRNTHSAALPQRQTALGVSVKGAPPSLLTAQPEVQRPLLTAPSPYTLSPHLVLLLVSSSPVLFSSLPHRPDHLAFPPGTGKNLQMSLNLYPDSAWILTPLWYFDFAWRPSQMPVWSHGSCVPSSLFKLSWLACPRPPRDALCPSFWLSSTLLFTLHLNGFLQFLKCVPTRHILPWPLLKEAFLILVLSAQVLPSGSRHWHVTAVYHGSYAMFICSSWLKLLWHVHEVKPSHTIFTFSHTLHRPGL